MDLPVFVEDSVRLPCHTSLPYPVDWRFTRFAYSWADRICSNGLISKRIQDRFAIDKPSEGRYDLVINRTQFDDAGLYTCEEDGGLGATLTIAVINVFGW